MLLDYEISDRKRQNATILPYDISLHRNCIFVSIYFKANGFFAETIVYVDTDPHIGFSAAGQIPASDGIQEEPWGADRG